MLMSCKEEFQFFKEWANYLKRGELSRLQAVLTRSPSNPTQLAFLLEIITQLCIFKAVGSTLSGELGRPEPFPLAHFVQLESINNLLTQDYVNKILSTYRQMESKLGQNLLLQPPIRLLIAILSTQCGSLELTCNIGNFTYLLSLGKCYYLLSNG